MGYTKHRISIVFKFNKNRPIRTKYMHMSQLYNKRSEVLIVLGKEKNLSLDLCKEFSVDF